MPALGRRRHESLRASQLVELALSVSLGSTGRSCLNK